MSEPSSRARSRAARTAAKARIPGAEDGFGPIGDLELREDRGGVVIDRLTGQAELPADHRGRQPCRKKLEDLPLAWSELREGVGRDRIAGQPTEHPPGDAGPKIASPAATERIARTISSWVAPLST